MIWRLIDDPASTGLHNMDYDIRLSQKCKDNEIYFRLYQWNPYSISLGANQNFEDVDSAKTDRDKIDVVKRPTGGRAIFHSEEITYSVVFPLSFGLSPKEIYKSISEALVTGLKIYDDRLYNTMLEQLQPNFSKILKSDSGSICFASTAKNEVKFAGRKLIGSAQKKMKNIVLQHGSILCGTKHRELINYLKLSENDRNKLSEEISLKTVEIETILNEKVDYKKLRKCLTLGFEKHFKIKFDTAVIVSH